MADKKDVFLLDWYKRLKLSINPFEEELIRPIDQFMAGNVEEKKKLNLFILEQHPFGMILGDKGFGKTILLRWIEEQLVPHEKKFHTQYVQCASLKTEQDLINTIIAPLMSQFEKTLTKPNKKLKIEEVGPYLAKKMKKKTLVLFVDDTDQLPPRFLPLFKHVFDPNLKLQMIMTSTGKSSAHTVGQEDKLKIHLKGLSLKEAEPMIKRRIMRAGGLDIYPFTPTIFKQIYQKSNKSPINLLKLCRDRALKLSLDKTYLEQVLARLESLKGKGKKKGFFRIRFMSDSEYQKQEMMKEMNNGELPEAPVEDILPIEEEPEMTEEEEKPVEKVSEEIVVQKAEEPVVVADNTKAKETLDTLHGLGLKEEPITANEVDATEIKYEFSEDAPKKEPAVQELPEDKPSTIEITDPKEEPDHHHGEKKEEPKKKHPQVTEEAKDTEDFIKELEKEFEK